LSDLSINRLGLEQGGDVANLRTGKPDVKPDVSAHTRGVSQGNEGRHDEQVGHLPDGRSTAERSTGINPKHQSPIDPRMPNLSPP
jgi:hypothetical protein